MSIITYKPSFYAIFTDDCDEIFLSSKPCFAAAMENIIHIFDCRAPYFLSVTRGDSTVVDMEVTSEY